MISEVVKIRVENVVSVVKSVDSCCMQLVKISLLLSCISVVGTVMNGITMFST